LYRWIRDACIVDKDVDPPECPHGCIDEASQLSFIAEIGCTHGNALARSAGAPCLVERLNIGRRQKYTVACV
jgi:hypothetical protein